MGFRFMGEVANKKKKNLDVINLFGGVRYQTHSFLKKYGLGINWGCS
jgi:hypothetical protein